ncbi:MAG: SurA N-terminal domain-containing protein [Bacillota bacterium]
MPLFRGFRGKKSSTMTKAVIIIISITFIGGLAYTGAVLTRPPVTGDLGVVASVDGKKIPWDLVDRGFKNALLAEYENTGRVLPETRGPIRASVLDQIINSVLIADAAKKAKIQVPAKQVEAEFKAQEESFPSKDAFRKALVENNLTVSEVKRQIRDRLTVQALLAKVKSGVTVSEDAVKEQYTKETGKPPEGKDFEEKRPGIESRLRSAAEQEAIVKWLEGLKKEAKIEILDPEIRAVKKLQEKAYDDAITIYNEAIRRKPEDPYLYVGLSQAYLGKHDLPGATKALEKAAELYPEEPYIRLLLGMAYRDGGSPDQACAEFKKASEHGSLDILLHIRLESLLRSMGRKDDAQAEQAKIAEIRELLERRSKASGASSQPAGAQGGTGTKSPDGAGSSDGQGEPEK